MVFGNEHEGISEEVKSTCDGLVHTPGFTESFNISVAASIFLFDLIQKTEKYNHPDFLLSDEVKHKLRLQWNRPVVKNSNLHEKMFQKILTTVFKINFS